MRIIFTFSLCVAFILANAQDTAKVRTFGGPYNDYGADIVETDGGGYAIIGTTGSYATGQSNMYLLKINSDLEKEWSTIFGGTNVEWGTAIEKVDDGFLLLGYTNSTSNGDYDIYLVKCDTDGALIWEKTYGGPDWEFGYDLLVENDRIYIAGESWSYTNGQSDGYLIEVDSEGNELWSEHFGGTNKDAFRDLFVGANEIVAVGTENIGTAESRVMLTSINTESAFESNFIDPLDLDSEGYAGFMHSSGNYYFVGAVKSENTSRYGVFRTTSDFEEIPLTGFLGGLMNTTNIAYSICESSTQDLIVTGESDSYTGSIGAYVVQLAPAGWFIEGPTFGGSATDIGRKLIINSEQELLMVGETNSFGIGNYDLYLVKFPNDTVNQNYVLDEEFLLDQLLTDIEEHETINHTSVMIAPNPTDNFTTVQSTDDWNSYSIFNLSGHLIQRNTLNKSGRIDLSNLSEGVYILQLENSTQSARTKLIVR